VHISRRERVLEWPRRRSRPRRSRPRSAAAGALASLGVAIVAVVGSAGGVHATGAARIVVQLEPEAVVVPIHLRAGPPTTKACQQATHGEVSCYDPAQLRTAYDLGPLYRAGVEGKGETIVIVDAFGSPTIAADLKTFDAAFSIPAPPSFRILTPTGPIPAYRRDGKDRYGWASETSLDVEWAHALAPEASIVLVETPTDEVEGTTGFPDIVAAEHYVLDHHLGDVISQSFGATEQTFTSYAQLAPLRSAFVQAERDHVSVLSGSGDLGATDFEDNASTIYPFRVTSWPASDPLVTAVGGTKLDLGASGTQLEAPVAWNDTFEKDSTPYPNASGGGRSIFFARPSYQDAVKAVTGGRRGVPDVAMSASCTAVVDVYVGDRGPTALPGWQPMCGTSEATPLFAAVVALADEEAGHPLGLLDPALYALLGVHDSGLVAVTKGNNTVAFTPKGGKRVTVVGFDASARYNLVTGVGTVDAARFVPALVRESEKLDPQR
jgi:subtilase family serine protease